LRSFRAASPFEGGVCTRDRGLDGGCRHLAGVYKVSSASELP
jgi:hypothetical protein